MPRKKVKTTTTYACNECKTAYTVKDKAVLCELEHKLSELDAIRDSIFPQYYEEKQTKAQRKNGYPKEDSRYTKYCVCCGDPVIEYDSYYDGHRNEVGDLIRSKPFSNVLGSRVCDDCQGSAKLSRMYKKLEDTGYHEKRVTLKVKVEKLRRKFN